jgi:hypothetical protein
MFVVVFDSVDDFVGPFNSNDEAEKWCIENGLDYYSVVELVPPDKFIK